MAIRVTCTCGKQFQVKEELAGKRGKCAACGQVLSIPAIPSSAALEKAIPAPLRACPACWEALQPNAVICLHCGHDLRTGKQVSQAKSAAPSLPTEKVPASSLRLWIAFISGGICFAGVIAAFTLLPRGQVPGNQPIALKADDAPGVPAIAPKAEDGAGVQAIAPKADVPLTVLGSGANAQDPKIKPKQEAWQNDYTLFLMTLDKEVQRSNPLAPVIDHLFKGKQVRWTLKYQGSKVEKKELQLQFDGVPQNLTFVSSEKAAPNWGMLKAGTPVTVEAKVMMAFVITLNPDGQGRGTKMGLVIFEDAKLAEKENPWAKATPSKLLSQLTTTSDNTASSVVTAEGQKELKVWEQRLTIEGKTGVNYAFISVNPSIRNIQVKMLDTHLGKPDRTTKELAAGLTVIPAEGGVAQEFPLETHWYGPVGFGFGRGNLQAIFYQLEKTDTDIKVFPAPAGTYKYRIKTDIVSIATESGDLVPAYFAIKKEMERLIADASQFDLTKNRDLTEYGKYVGEQLKLAKGKAIGFEIATESGKELFIGKLEIGKSGGYEMTPSGATDEPAKGSVKVSGVSLEKGELTVEIDWGKVPPTLEAKDVTLVLLFQAKSEPIMKLDGTALAKLSDNWEVGLLANDGTWVLRTAGDAKKLGEVLQIISGGGKAKEGPDFRKNGKYPLRFRLSYSANARWLNTENVQVALFQQTDPKKWQQTSTNYRLLSNVAEMAKPPEKMTNERKPDGADPKPASSPQFDTPLGYYAGVGQIKGGKVKSRVLTGLTIVGDKTEAKYDHGETKAGSNEALVWVRFHTPKAIKNDIHFDKYSAVIDEKSYPVLASTTDLNAEFAEAIRKATTQHGTVKSTYLLFAIPERATKFRLVYGDTGLELAVPGPTVPEEVAPENATPNPTPGRDSVGVSIFDRTTGKVGDIPPTATQKLLEFSLTLDLSRAADRDKLIKKWHELAGEKADRYTITIWAAAKQYRWPPAVPTLGKDDEKTKAKKQAFADGLDYFIWSTEKERVKSQEGLLRMLIGFEYELNSEKTEGPFSIIMSFEVKDSASSKNYEHQGVFTPEKLENLKSGRTGAVLFGAQSLKGEGDAVIYLTKKSDTKKPISNKIKVPVLFDN